MEVIDALLGAIGALIIALQIESIRCMRHIDARVRTLETQVAVTNALYEQEN